jgi:hypothetical protein
MLGMQVAWGARVYGPHATRRLFNTPGNPSSYFLATKRKISFSTPLFYYRAGITSLLNPVQIAGKRAIKSLGLPLKRRCSGGDFITPQ